MQSLNSLVKISLQWSPTDEPSSVTTLHMKSVCNLPQPRGGHTLTAISYGLLLCGGACITETMPHTSYDVASVHFTDVR